MELNEWLTAIKALVAIAGLVFGVYEMIKAKKFGAALNLTQKTLDGMVAAIETLPEDEKTRAVKRRIKAVSLELGTNQEVLSDIVKEVSAIFKERGITGSGDVTGAAIAVSQIRSMRKDGKPNVPNGEKIGAGSGADAGSGPSI